jgi:hypothetical protein
MEAENRTEGDLTRLGGTGDAKGDDGAVREARGAEGGLTVSVESQVAEMSNKKRREARSIVNRSIHRYPGGEEKLFEDIASGIKITDIVGRLEVSEGAFYAWAETTPKRSEEFSRARARAAHALAEQGLTIVDSADVATANLANVRARYRQWLAGKWNQQAYGENKTQVNVQVNITDAHLMANRYRETVNAVNVDDNTIDVAPHNG